MSSDTAPLLNDLCSICTAHPPIYQCPRCSTRTCSLPCSKRHKTWSQCNGIRDPTAYVKRSRLATAAGIDHDFNFLSKVERAVANADREAGERGVELEFGVRLPVRVGREEAVRRAVEESGVRVQRAPKGMARQRANGTHVSARKNLIWTVEWLHPNGTKTHSECNEDASMSTLYREATSVPSKKRKRKHLHGRLGNSTQGVASVTARDHHDDVKPADDVKPDGDEKSNVNANSLEFDDMKPNEDAKPGDDIETVIKPETSETLPSPTPSAHDGADAQSDIARGKPTPSESSPTPSLPHHHHYYLHKPFVRSKARVLIPLDSDTSLRDCLRGQEVFEYPTIHVLQAVPEALPAGFVLERTYQKMGGGRGLIQEVDEETKGGAKKGKAAGAEQSGGKTTKVARGVQAESFIK